MTAIQQIIALRREGRHEEALELALAAAATNPDDPMLRFHTACLHDALGLESAAVPHYRAAIALGLPDEELEAAYLGLGSTFRALGRYAEADTTLADGRARFPGSNALAVFHAMALFNLGRPQQAFELLLVLLARTSGDEGIRGYARAIEFYAQDITKSWPSN